MNNKTSTFHSGPAHLGADSVKTDPRDRYETLGDAEHELTEYGQDISALLFNGANRSGDFDGIGNLSGVDKSNLVAVKFCQEVDLAQAVACFNASVQMTGAAMLAREIRQGCALIAAALSGAGQVPSATPFAMNTTAANEG